MCFCKKNLSCYNLVNPYNLCFHLLGKEHLYPSCLQRKPWKQKVSEPEKLRNPKLTKKGLNQTSKQGSKQTNKQTYYF